MIKLQDFARQMGVTDRAIQKHLKKYADELDGLYQRKGPNGTWLTDEACEILRNKMRQQPMAVADTQIYRELEEAKKKIEKLQDEKANLAAMNAVLSEWKAEKAVAIAAAEQTKLMLDATKAELDQVKLDLAAKNSEVEVANQKAEKADQAATAADKQAAEAKDKAKELEKDLAYQIAMRTAAEAELDELEKMGRFKRFFWNGRK